MGFEVYKKLIIIQHHHLDELNHVNNVVYLQWVQEAAKEHWLKRTDESINAKYFWVVRSHHLEYKKQAFLEDQLEVRTFVVNYKGPFSVRAVDFYRNDEIVVACRSNWCLISSEDQKPKRVPEEIQQLFGSSE